MIRPGVHAPVIGSLCSIMGVTHGNRIGDRRVRLNVIAPRPSGRGPRRCPALLDGVCVLGAVTGIDGPNDVVVGRAGNQAIGIRIARSGHAGRDLVAGSRCESRRRIPVDVVRDAVATLAGRRVPGEVEGAGRILRIRDRLQPIKTRSRRARTGRCGRRFRRIIRLTVSVVRPHDVVVRRAAADVGVAVCRRGRCPNLGVRPTRRRRTVDVVFRGIRYAAPTQIDPVVTVRSCRKRSRRRFGTDRAVRILERGDASMPLEVIGRRIVLLRVPEGAVVRRIDAHRGVVTPPAVPVL